jgi:hypothetical protein
VKEARLVGVSAYQRQDLVEAAVLLESRAELAYRVISDVLPLERAADALESSRSGAVSGKILLDCGLGGTSKGRSR